jgi:DNA-binding transcriptional regulator GbsR (MarR family)
MSDEKIDLESFLEELVSAIERRLKQQEKAIKRLERELESLKAGQGVRIDRSVMKVLGGK